jgi:hypothetical protein
VYVSWSSSSIYGGDLGIGFSFFIGGVR